MMSLISREWLSAFFPCRDSGKSKNNGKSENKTNRLIEMIFHFKVFKCSLISIRIWR